MENVFFLWFTLKKKSLSISTPYFTIERRVLIDKTLCGTQPQYPKMEMVFAVPGMSNPQYYNFVADEWDFNHYTPLTAKWTEFLNTTYSAQVKFMNETYGADWAYEPV